MGGSEFEQDVRPGALGKGNPRQYDYDTIVSYLHGARPTVLAEVSRAYASAKRAFEQADRGLAEHVRQLGSAWEGAAQELGVADLKRLADSASALAAASGQFESAMTQAQGVVEIAKATTPGKSAVPGVLPGNSPIEVADKQAADDKAAQAHLAKTNTRLASAYSQIPDTVALDLPAKKQGQRENPYPRAGTGSNAPGAGTAPSRTHHTAGGIGADSAPPAGVNGPQPPGSHGPTRPGGGLSGGPGNPSDLAGAHPTLPGGGVGPVAGGPPPAPAPGGGPSGGAIPGGGIGLPVSPPPGATGAGRGGPRGATTPSGLLGRGARAGEPSLPVRGVIGSKPGGEGVLPGEAGTRGGMAGARGVAADGAPGMPMGAGGAGRGARGQERSTWLTEDPDVWDEEGDAAPRVIGGPDRPHRSR